MCLTPRQGVRGLHGASLDGMLGGCLEQGHCLYTLMGSAGYLCTVVGLEELCWTDVEALLCCVECLATSGYSTLCLPSLWKAGQRVPALPPAHIRLCFAAAVLRLGRMHGQKSICPAPLA